MSREIPYIPFVLFLVVAVVYGNALHGSFQFDDYIVIVDSGLVHSWSAWYADLFHGLRPLLKLSFMFNWVSGTGVEGFHVFNILVHFINVLLVYALAVRLFGRIPDDVQRTRTGALVTGLLFAVHPVFTEAITYISGRSMSLMTLFYLASFLSYIKGREEKRAVWVAGISPLLFILAVATKETAITLPFALLLWETCFAADGFGPVMRRQTVHWLVFLALVMLLLFQDRYWQMMAFSAALHGMQENLLTQLHAMTYMLGQFLLPWRLNIDPDLPHVTAWAQAMPDIVLWSFLAAVAVWNARKRPLLLFAFGWFVLQMLPIYVFLPRLDVANERQLYLAGWVLILPVAQVVCDMPFHARLRVATTMALMLLLGVLTVLRNEDYRTEVSLWGNTVLNSPHKARPYNNLGYAYYLAGNRAGAEQAYQKAISLKPGYWLAENNLDRIRRDKE